MSVLGREDRGPYDCLLVEYDVPGSGKLRSFLLLPDGASAQEPCPGLVLLHDHGARFDIGKEKLARPMASAPLNIRRSALQWVRDNFDGVFLADSLAGLGYAVIVPDMLYWGGRSTGLARRWSRMRFCGEAGDIDSVKTALYEGQKAVYARGPGRPCRRMPPLPACCAGCPVWTRTGSPSPAGPWGRTGPGCWPVSVTSSLPESRYAG